MTDEQIKQNAEAYADVFGRHMADYYGVKDAFSSGAHSRDEEIGRMNTTIRLYANQIAQLRKEIEQLRNQWISVEERLPKKTRNFSPFPDEYDEKVVLVINKQGGKRLAYRDYKGVWRDDYTCEIANQKYARITHWMPIPQIEKGE